MMNLGILHDLRNPPFSQGTSRHLACRSIAVIVAWRCASAMAVPPWRSGELQGWFQPWELQAPVMGNPWWLMIESWDVMGI
jgi:hypothetical protein